MSKAKSALLVISLIALLGAAGVYWFVIKPDPAAIINENRAAGPQVPDLGSRGKPVPEPANQPAPDNTIETTDPATDGTTEHEPEAANSAREIDIWLSNLAIATKAGDNKGIALNHEMLKKARPDALVDERVRAALDNEQSAWVRIQFYLAFHEPQPRFDWAMHVYDTRTAKFMGTDDQYTGGEIEELKLIAKELFAKLIESWHADGTADSRLMALVRNILETEKPEWMLELALRDLSESVLVREMQAFARAIEQELRGLLLRRTAELPLRELAFFMYVLAFDPHAAVLDQLALPEWWDYAESLALAYGERPPAPVVLRSGMIIEWIEALIQNRAVPKLFETLLQGNMPADSKRLLIQRIAAYNVPFGREMIEAGLARQDANYPDYLAAFGRFAETATDLQRLTGAADEPDVAAAQGAIEGLRLSALAVADVELRKVLEQGANPGVKSQALGALLSRAKDKDALLEEYLDANKDSSLRAVAALHVPLTDVERLQRIVEEDLSPSVRMAALNRVGSIVPESVFQRKELRGWFIKIKDRDPTSTIRAAARKYAEALDVKEE